jgi:hypothetical protein
MPMACKKPAQDTVLMARAMKIIQTTMVALGIGLNSRRALPLKNNQK